MTKPICIYHGNCADGFTAAWAVWKRFGDRFDYHAGVYQQPPPDVTGRDVVLVDFSYKSDVLIEMRKLARSILVLDHHKSAAEDLVVKPVNEGTYYLSIADQWGPNPWVRHRGNADEDWLQGAGWIYVSFDMNRSGAGLAWDFFHPGKPRPALINFVEDRDLWRFKLPGSRAINAVVFSYPYEFEAWNELNRFIEHAPQEAERAGMAIERKHHKDVAELVKAFKRDMVIGGYRVPIANLPYTLTSDAGHLMCSEWNGDMCEDGVTGAPPPFAACYWDTPKGRVFSLRSVGDFDVSAVAAKYGGGGHKNASGFTLPHGVEP